MVHIIKRFIVTLAALISLSVSLPGYADGMSDVNYYCTVCHAGLTVNGTVIGDGSRLAANRGYQGWVDTIDRMNSKGCGVPSGSITGMATYLASLETTTTTLPFQYCYSSNCTRCVNLISQIGVGCVFLSPTPTCAVITNSDYECNYTTNLPTTTTTSSSSTTVPNTTTTTTSTSTTTTLPPVPCYDRNGAAQTAAWCAKRKRR